MRIQSTQNYQYNQKNPQFKSAFPVVHWVAESNGSFAPISDLPTVKKLQGKLIRILNKSLTGSKKPMNPTEQSVRSHVGSCDAAYRIKAIVRSFYDRITGNPRNFTPTSYIISGKDVEIFENLFAKDIGRAKGCGINTPETNFALEKYHKRGLDFVRNDSRQIKDRKGIPYILHTKFETVRNKFNEIVDYRFLDARFLPAKGPKNPFVRVGLVKE